MYTLHMTTTIITRATSCKMIQGFFRPCADL